MGGTFSADLSRFCKKYQVDMRTVVRKITLEAFKRVILRTPVDTGRARANWGVSQGRPITFQIEGADKSGSATISTAADGVQSWECQGSLFLTNNLAYIGVLEYGKDDGSPGSSQAPNGMVRVTLEEMQAWIQNSVKKETISSIKDRG